MGIRPQDRDVAAKNCSLKVSASVCLPLSPPAPRLFSLPGNCQSMCISTPPSSRMHSLPCSVLLSVPVIRPHPRLQAVHPRQPGPQSVFTQNPPTWKGQIPLGFPGWAAQQTCSARDPIPSASHCTNGSLGKQGEPCNNFPDPSSPQECSHVAIAPVLP